MSQPQSEYSVFCSKYDFDDIEYRKKPAKEFLASRFDHSKIYTKDESNDKTIFLHEPLTSLQKYIGEPAEDYAFVEIFGGETMMRIMIYFAGFAVTNLSVAVKGRILPPVTSYLGETFELVDSEVEMLVIGEKVSENPAIYMGHYESKAFKMTSHVSKDYKYEADKIKVKCNDKSTLTYKKDGSEFTMNRPDFIIHLEDKSDPWVEFKGKQIVQHTKSKARVEITYKGCHKYSTEDCIEGKVYDSDDKLYATLRGSYLTSLYIAYEGSDEEMELVKFKGLKTFFDNYFSFTSWTLTLNDPIYDVKCPTDSRLRGDIALLEKGEIEEALKIKKSIKERVKQQEEERKKTGTEFTPKWFKKIENKESKDIDYEYAGKYWEAKLSGKY